MVAGAIIHINFNACREYAEMFDMVACAAVVEIEHRICLMLW